MEFCPKCGTLLRPQEIKNKEADEGDINLICPKCDFKKSSSESYVKREEYQVEKEEVLIEEGNLNLPGTKADCPECKNKEAYYWIEQTRSSDEAPTRFYKCKKCKHTWREYT